METAVDASERTCRPRSVDAQEREGRAFRNRTRKWRMRRTRGVSAGRMVTEGRKKEEEEGQQPEFGVDLLSLT